MIFYPEVKKAIAEAKEIVLESLEEHNVIKWELDAIRSSKIADAHLDAKIKVLKDAVMRHVEEEESVLFPMVREEMSASKLAEIGKRPEQVKNPWWTARWMPCGRPCEGATASMRRPRAAAAPPRSERPRTPSGREPTGRTPTDAGPLLT